MHKNAARKVVRHEAVIQASVEKVFSLLCPVREYEWIQGWSCNLKYSDSGTAEKGAVFTTDFRAEGHSVWTVSRYEPNEAIEFVVVFPGSHVMTIAVALAALETGRTRLLWTCTYTSLVDSNGFVESIDQDSFDQHQRHFDHALEHYCMTGAMLTR
jgi:hypothetical protein